MEKVTILQYSPKAIVATGNTKPIKDRLKALGGAWNARLKHPITGEPLMGWIFTKHKIDKVRLVCLDAKRDGLIGGVDVPLSPSITDKTVQA